MTVENWERVKELLDQVIGLAPAQRAQFLDEACGSDSALRVELESLLPYGEELNSDFLESPLHGELNQDVDRIEVCDGLASGQVIVRRFQLIHKLGEGGMGQVWLAEQLSPVRRQVALKLIKAGMYDESIVQRFQSERQSLAIMDHPCIAKVFDAGTTPQGQPFFVMEYVPGLPITEYCDQRKLDIRARLQLFIQACVGVQHAHQKAIIHRDLKPANILVVDIDGKAVPRIIDFGLAKAMVRVTEPADQTMLTRFGHFMGTPGYMSPEQVNPDIHDIDTRTDVYSLGVILYVLLTGLQPFESKRRQRPPLDEWLRQLREKDADPSTALDITLSVLTNPVFVQDRSAATVDTFQLIRASDKLLEVISSHGRRITGGDMSPDGNRVVLALDDNTAVVTDARTGAAMTVLADHTGVVRQAAFSPDGELIITGSLDKTARLWNARTGAPLRVLLGHSDSVQDVAFSPDGGRIATASSDGTARIWDSKTGAQLVVLSGHSDRVISVRFSPDGRRALTASWDKSARIWDVRTGRQISALPLQSNRLDMAAYSRDGALIVTAGWDQTARVWDARTGVMRAVCVGHRGQLESADFSNDGQVIVTTASDATVRLWDANTGAAIAVLTGHHGITDKAVYTRDGTRILSTSWDGTARIWDATAGAPLSILRGHTSDLSHAEFSPDGKHVVTSSWDRTIRTWDARAGTPDTVFVGHLGIVNEVTFSPNGERLVSAGNDGARLWDSRTGKPLAVLHGHSRAVESASFSPDGSRIVTASDDGTARIWDASTGGTLGLITGHHAPVTSAAFSPDSTLIVTGGEDDTARVWDARTGRAITLHSGHTERVETAMFSPDGAHLVTASDDKIAAIWDARMAGASLISMVHPAEVNSAAYSPDGRRIVTASRDNVARIWDSATGVLLGALKGHTAELTYAAYSPDGRTIVTASADQTARIWDAQVPAELAAQILWAAAAQVDYSAEGDRLQLGLPPDPHVRAWFATLSPCDQAAAAVDDPDRVAPGVLSPALAAEIAISACRPEVDPRRHAARYDYEMARALLAKPDPSAAQQFLEVAVDRGYRAAEVELANLLVRGPARGRDWRRAVSLYRRAWDAGVPIAAFELGQLYEQGLSTGQGIPNNDLLPDGDQAAMWYQKGATAGEPHALAHLAEGGERSAFAQSEPDTRSALLLRSFKQYAQAAEYARLESWPDVAWKDWRFRRASLARLLAKEGMMQQVAEAYAGIRGQRTLGPTPWENFKDALRVGLDAPQLHGVVHAIVDALHEKRAEHEHHQQPLHRNKPLYGRSQNH